MCIVEQSRRELPKQKTETKPKIKDIIQPERSKFCPLTRNICKQNACMWWIGDSCAVVVIAKELALGRLP